MAKNKRKLTPVQLEAHLAEQIGFLKASADSYDQGMTGEAKRIAVVLRVLLHNTSRSHSLLGQLSRLNGSFVSTALPHEPKNQGTHGGLVSIAMKGSDTRYIPVMDGFFRDWLAYDNWWNQAVFVDDRRDVLTRRDLVLTTANQDGGAHVDPGLDETYARLKEDNSLGWMYTSPEEQDQPIPGAEKAAVRQVGHEVLMTLIPGYHKKVEVEAEMFLHGAMVVEGSKPPPMPKARTVKRNEKCPCGSGKKYKQCHGDPALEFQL